MSPSEPPDVSALFAAYHAALYRYIARFTGDADVAGDVVQETFIRLVEHPPGETDRVRAWLFTVATNIARDSLKTAGRRQRLLAGDPSRIPVGNPEPDPADVLERDEARERVRRGLAALSEKERMILLMREEGFKHREIAEAVGTTTGSIGTLVARALAKLARHLGLDAHREDT